jgi:hypothetical protein
MKTTKVYKTQIGTKLAILKAKLKNFFNGSHYVAETFTTRYNNDTKEYTLEHYTMTHDEEKQFNAAVAEQQLKIAELIESQMAEKSKAEKWADDVERNRQKQLAENESKKNTNTTAKPKAPKTDTPKMVAGKPKRKYTKPNKVDNKA